MAFWWASGLSLGSRAHTRRVWCGIGCTALWFRLPALLSSRLQLLSCSSLLCTTPTTLLQPPHQTTGHHLGAARHCGRPPAVRPPHRRKHKQRALLHQPGLLRRRIIPAGRRQQQVSGGALGMGGAGGRQCVHARSTVAADGTPGLLSGLKCIWFANLPCTHVPPPTRPPLQVRVPVRRGRARHAAPLPDLPQPVAGRRAGPPQLQVSSSTKGWPASQTAPDASGSMRPAGRDHACLVPLFSQAQPGQ